MKVPYRQIRAVYDDDTVTVYQAYSSEIAGPAVRAGRFVPPFKRSRMTWIKPSFLWMMYRCGWAAKPGQEHVLAVSITRAGFEWALAHAALSHYDRDLHPDRSVGAAATKVSPVRVQWDPERTLRLQALPYRSLQVGLSGPAAERYADEWITGIRDVTGLAREIHGRLAAGDDAGAGALLPVERPYPLTGERGRLIGADAGPGQEP